MPARDLELSLVPRRGERQAATCGGGDCSCARRERHAIHKTRGQRISVVAVGGSRQPARKPSRSIACGRGGDPAVRGLLRAVLLHEPPNGPGAAAFSAGREAAAEGAAAARVAAAAPVLAARRAPAARHALLRRATDQPGVAALARAGPAALLLSEFVGPAAAARRAAARRLGRRGHRAARPHCWALPVGGGDGGGGHGRRVASAPPRQRHARAGGVPTGARLRLPLGLPLVGVCPNGGLPGAAVRVGAVRACMPLLSIAALRPPADTTSSTS